MIVSENNKYYKLADFDGEEYGYIDIKKAASDAGFDLNLLPFCLRVLFENVVRYSDDPSKLAIF